MSLRGSSKKRTLCEVLREINDILVYGVRNKIIRKEYAFKIQKRLIEAEGMGKRMSIKLREYNQKYQVTFWKDNKDYLEDMKRREKIKIKGGF